MTELNPRNRLAAIGALCLLLVVGWFVYAPARGGDFLLDDESNLGGLKQVTDSESALQFVFSGTAGPIGRPLALATFLPQADTMKDGARSFLTFNILLHLLNAGLLALLLYRLSLARQTGARDAFLIAISAMAMWLFMPLLASSTLMVIQRMTTLSATFSLLGLIGYLYARQGMERNSRAALTGMSMALAAGVLLATLAKENGVLLPVLVLAVEGTLLTRPDAVGKSTWRMWSSVFLLAPAVLILAYLLMRVPYAETLVLRRDFTGWQRILTEAVILWEYLLRAFVPQPGMFGPFHDGYPVARSILDPVAALALAGWLATSGLAVAWRRRFPLFAFAVFWYIGGHLLESTTLPLELYFEHRNYLPIIGPVYALCAVAFTAPAHRMRLVRMGLAAYVAVQVIVLFGLTSLWSNPPLAAHYWQQKFPLSIRAKTTAAGYPISADWAQKTLGMLNQLANDRPDAAYLKIQELDLACVLAPADDHSATVRELDRSLGNVEFTYTTSQMLSNLITTTGKVDCNGVDDDTVRQIANALLANPRYRNDPLYNQMHQQLLARLAKREGDVPMALNHLEKAIAIRPTADLNMMMVTTYVDSGAFASAHDFVDAARSNPPWHPLKRYVWLSRLDGLERFIDEVEQKPEPNMHTQ